jgi:hypothetical protein
VRVASRLSSYDSKQIRLAVNLLASTRARVWHSTAFRSRDEHICSASAIEFTAKASCNTVGVQSHTSSQVILMLTHTRQATANMDAIRALSIADGADGGHGDTATDRSDDASRPSHPEPSSVSVCADRSVRARTLSADTAWPSLCMSLCVHLLAHVWPARPTRPPHATRALLNHRVILHLYVHLCAPSAAHALESSCVIG